jgi:hypothetical protein
MSISGQLGMAYLTENTHRYDQERDRSHPKLPLRDEQIGQSLTLIEQVALPH